MVIYGIGFSEMKLAGGPCTVFWAAWTM